MIKLSLLKHLFCKCAAMWKQVEQSSLAFLPRSAISFVSQQGPLIAENTPPLPPLLQQGFPVEEETKSNSPYFLFSPSCGFNFPDTALLFPGTFRCLSRSCTEHSLLPLCLDRGAGLSLMKATHCICVSDHDLLTCIRYWVLSVELSPVQSPQGQLTIASAEAGAMPFLLHPYLPQPPPLPSKDSPDQQGVSFSGNSTWVNPMHTTV